MNKKLLSVFLTIAIIVQLAFPVGALISAKVFENNFEKYGQIYKIKLSTLSYDSYGAVIDESQIGMISYGIDAALPDDNYLSAYAKVTVGEDGYAKLEFSKSKPKGENYLKEKYGWEYNFLEEYEYIKKIGMIESVRFIKTETGYEYFGNEKIRQNVNDIYVEAKIYKGKGVALDFYVDGEKLEDVLSDLNNRL